MDHLTGNRFEWGTGRGAGSHEIASFNILDKDSTKVEWEEVIKEIPRMWEQEDYEFKGDHFEVPYPHNILPKPYGKGHPPIWMACGNPPSFGRAGELGLGAIAFNFEPIHNLKGRCDAYKEAAANCTEPLGQYKNDNIMMTNAVICLEDRKRAREIALSAGRGYLNTMVAMYHDTMPKKEGAPVWPAAPIGIPNEDILDQVIANGIMLCGTPDEVAEQLAAYEAVGCDQVVFGFPPEGAEPDEVTEIIELFGSKVIPQFDTDPVHSTTRYRAQAQPKYPRWNNPGAIEGLSVDVLPTSALLPLP
jgi:alkanesulfonate monooxygenase SsuD/methylene tetrahydromethanopterin reductase-like flavin-dependent oxidoreductase (luciferase family)